MSFTQNFYTSRGNFGDGQTRIGENGRLWYDSTTNTIRVSDGSTPGGIIVSSGVTNPFNQTLNTYNDAQFANLTVTGTTTATGDITMNNRLFINQR